MKKDFFGNDKHVFWEALVVAVFIFGIGIIFGIFLENSRAERISEIYSTSEINLLDLQIQTELLGVENINCEQAVKKNIEFADKVYEDAKILEEYERASRLKENLVQQHERYDLLRTLLWLNSLKIKERCDGGNFHTVVYLYDYLPEDIEEKNKQAVFSRFLEELKEEKGDTIILIPIAKNLDISSLDLLIEGYGIEQTSIILDETLVVEELSDLNKIEEKIDSSL
ncbi:hypothetical protein CMI44_00965 [Candidatus Pacearchaeota archaeon]|nr:hypothetical protein [Candidatus Pacearchaeota archaeon]